MAEIRKSTSEIRESIAELMGAQRGTDEQIRLMKGKKGGNSRVIKREGR